MRMFFFFCSGWVGVGGCGGCEYMCLYVYVYSAYTITILQIHRHPKTTHTPPQRTVLQHHAR